MKVCGICGVVRIEEDGPADLDLLEQMISAIRYRGPDAYGVYRTERAGLAHARLSIVDLAGGKQPMANEDGSLWIVFNGEIYNHSELRPELQRRGHRFATRCDTEVILHLYEDYGPTCLDRLNGQFAFAIWDEDRRTLFMARDRVGIRPLYYTRAGFRFAFASEVKSLYQVPGVERKFDPVGLDQIFTFWCPLDPRTAFANIHQVPPGHYVTVAENGATTVHRYWDYTFPDAHAENSAGTDREWIDRLRNEIIRSTRLRMRADVPVAAYLSGGLDSSLTTAVITSQTNTTLRSFSVRFHETGYDEGACQNAVVRELGTQHESVWVSANELAEGFSDVIHHVESPILRAAPVPLYFLSRLVREAGVKVAVTGEGADEVFGGYNIFKEAKIRRFWARHPDSALRPLLLSRIYPYISRSGHNGAENYWRMFFSKGLNNTNHPCYSHLVRWSNTAKLKQFFSPGLAEQTHAYDAIAEIEAGLPASFATWEPLAQAQYIEMTTFMAGYLLNAQGDRVAMAHAVEGRYPFLDHELIEFAASIPSRLKLRVLEEKHILRKLAREFLPRSVCERPKQPYRAPDAAMLQSQTGRDLLDSALSASALSDAGCFAERAVTQLRRKALQREPQDLGARDTMALIGILATQLLHQHFIRRPPRVEPIQKHQIDYVRVPASSRESMHGSST